MRGRAPALGLLGLALLVAPSCRTTPLAGDPFAPGVPARGSQERLFEVDWWAQLVPSTFLEYQPRETATPAVDPDSGTVIACTRDGNLRALAADDGRVLWTRKTGGRCFAGGAVYDGVLYQPAGDGSLQALKVADGTALWRYNAGEELVTTPVLTEGRVLVASQNDTLFAVDAATGTWVWQHRRDVPSGFTVRGTAAPKVEDGVVYMGHADGHLVALQAKDGAVLWERLLSLSGGTEFLDVDTTPVLDGQGHVFGASYKDGLFALSAKTGEVEWNTAVQGVSALASRGDVLFGSGDGVVRAVQASTGRTLWSLDLSSKGKRPAGGRPPLVSGELLFVPTTGALVAVDTSTGKAKLAWDPGKGVSASPVRHGRRLYVLSNLGSVFALRLVGSGG